MEYPFKVGEEYRNRIGRYQVLAIQEPKMLIRYEDGREQLVSIAIQARIWQGVQFETAPPKAVDVGQKRRQKSSTSGLGTQGSIASNTDAQEKLIAEILENDDVIFEILTRLTIPPGQIDIYRFFLKLPDDYFSRQQIADVIRSSDRASLQGVFMAFGRRIGSAPDQRVRSLRPLNSLVFHHKRQGGNTLYRIRQRAAQIFETYPKFYDFLINDTRNWLPDEFGSPYWTNSSSVHRLQMQYLGLWDRYQASKGS